MVICRRDVGDDAAGAPCPECGHTGFLHHYFGNRTPDGACVECRMEEGIARLEGRLSRRHGVGYNGAAAVGATGTASADRGAKENKMESNGYWNVLIQIPNDAEGLDRIAGLEGVRVLSTTLIGEPHL